MPFMTMLTMDLLLAMHMISCSGTLSKDFLVYVVTVLTLSVQQTLMDTLIQVVITVTLLQLMDWVKAHWEVTSKLNLIH
jgi:hypothetical protein